MVLFLFPLIIKNVALIVDQLQLTVKCFMVKKVTDVTKGEGAQKYLNVTDSPLQVLPADCFLLSIGTAQKCSCEVPLVVRAHLDMA